MLEETTAKETVEEAKEEAVERKMEQEVETGEIRALRDNPPSPQSPRNAKSFGRWTPIIPAVKTLARRVRRPWGGWV